MNKYMGFYELNSSSLPTVPWQQFMPDTRLDKGLLWTVRVAVESGNDHNLPRAVGVPADEAELKGNEFLSEYGSNGIVIYYPYFIAEKSGVLDINGHRTVIEAVEKDLWNLVTFGRKNVTVILEKGQEEEYFGQADFLDKNEIDELVKYASVISGRYRQELSEGKFILAEWSYAYNTDIHYKPIGERYLVFYELRTI
ncbi:MAG: hypothetical protein GXY17_04815 [Clostridiaceae bacterium]|nr:hypothetical protein [Clostridiaceae bacterium]